MKFSADIPATATGIAAKDGNIITDKSTAPGEYTIPLHMCLKAESVIDNRVQVFNLFPEMYPPK